MMKVSGKDVTPRPTRVACRGFSDRSAAEIKFIAYICKQNG